MPRRIAFVSTPVAPIGSGDGGGVETTLQQLTCELAARGHSIAVIAPTGSILSGAVRVYEVSGALPASAAVTARNIPHSFVSDGALERMWAAAREIQGEYDFVIAMTYDWLSYYLTSFFSIPVLHFVTLPSSIDVVDQMIAPLFALHPERFAFYSRAQAETFPFVDNSAAVLIPGAVDTTAFPFRAEATRALAWSARISPEKGLEDAVAVAQAAGFPLHVCGKIQDQAYWKSIRSRDVERRIIYHGMLDHIELPKVLGSAAATLATAKWIEAFGLSVVESLACGTPVIAYARGGPAEIIEDAKSGYLVPQNDVAAMVDAVRKIPAIQRIECRRRAEEYSIGKMASRFEAWIDRAVGS